MNKTNVKVLITKKQHLQQSFRQTFRHEKQNRNGAIAIEKEKCGINLNKPNLYWNKHIRFKQRINARFSL